MKAVVLIDNKTKEDVFSPEWGLSILIDYREKRYLLDTGSSPQFASNAKTMGIDLSSVDYGILSHAHYDHANGMKEFFDVNKKAKMHIAEGTECNCYFKYGFVKRYIGIKPEYMEENSDRIVKVIMPKSGFATIDEGVYIVPHRTKGLQKIGKKNHMYLKTDRAMAPDDFRHEQSLVFDTSKGLAVFNSCSHGGVANIIREVQAAIPDRNVYCFVGGFHLAGSSKRTAYKVAEEIAETQVKRIITGHCTGDKAYRCLEEVLGDRIEQLYTGMKFEV